MARIVHGYGTLHHLGGNTYGEAYGDVSIQHGYGRGEVASLGDASFAFYADAPGRTPGDDYSQPPYNIPLDVDVNTDPIALQALALGISYVQAQTVDPAMATKINDSISAIAMWAAKLVKAASESGRGAALKADADNWLRASALFQDQGQRLISGELPSSRFTEWSALGQRLAATASSLSNELGLPLLTIGGALDPAGFDKAMAFLKFLAYSGIAITGLYFGAQVLGFVKQSRRG